MATQVSVEIALPCYKYECPEPPIIYDVYRIVRGDEDEIFSCIILLDPQHFWKIQSRDFTQVP